MADTRVTRVPAVASFDRWLSVANATAERPVHERALATDGRAARRRSVQSFSSLVREARAMIPLAG